MGERIPFPVAEELRRHAGKELIQNGDGGFEGEFGIEHVSCRGGAAVELDDRG
ncbi:hypothetical protein SDC9_200160 [bioreactor metagenome]|uniref:Uncharacterized protein n=1 Tax=bioreactor metagenome TaxID=1076179 RepID=A0A645IMH0_9ZZZZ